MYTEFKTLQYEYVKIAIISCYTHFCIHGGTVWKVGINTQTADGLYIFWACVSMIKNSSASLSPLNCIL